MLGQCISSFFPASPEPISRSVRQNRFKSVAGLVGSLGTKQNDKSGIDTVLKDFPLFCPKCKLTHIIDVEKLEIVIKNTEKQTFII
ncbi:MULTISPECIES: cysteine-rich KTR domain-containing protein [Bacillota]|jgi:hypothetical protein|nr:MULTISPECIES: cysteine-rich KTR domain-containing protein [Bacillota]